MHATIARIRANPLFRAAIVAPILIMIVFSLFNLTSVTDQSRVPAALAVGVVNLDMGGPDGTALAGQMIAGMDAQMPMAFIAFADETAARGALADGDVSAVMVFPEDFTRAVVSGTDIGVRLIATQHLSLAETQLGAALGGQLQAALTAAVAGMRLAAAGEGGPPAAGAPAAQSGPVVTTEMLYAAEQVEALSAPFVMTYATWLASFVGGLMAFLATRALKGSEAVAPVSAVRSALPLLVPALAGLALAVVVAWTTGQWGIFLSLWLFIWLATTAISLLMAGLFALFGFFAIIVALPAAFYQSALSGAQAPIGAIPDWLRSIAEAIPFSDIATGYRSLVIGGPEGSLPIGLLIAVAVTGLALVWVGTWIHHGVLARRAAAIA